LVEGFGEGLVSVEGNQIVEKIFHGEKKLSTLRQFRLPFE
jgi:hypothetical protein